MRAAALRPPIVGLLAVATALAVPPPVGAHGGTEIAQGGSGGVRIVVDAAETTTTAGRPAVDLSTTLRGRGTGDGATVTYWVRPSGGETFRATTTRDEAGVAHTDVPTAGRGDWRAWDVSAVVALSTGGRLRVSNAEASPPGPEPAATPGGGATGADDAEAAAGGTAPDATTTGTVPAPAGEVPPAGTTTTGATDGAVEDVTGQDDEGAPTWAIVSVPVVLVLAGVAIVVGRRRRATDADRAD